MVTVSVQGAAITSGRCSKTARRLTPPEAVNMNMSFIEPNMTLWSPNNPDLNPVGYMLFGERFRRWFTTAEVSSLCKNYKVQLVAAQQQLSQAFLEQSISEWRRRIENVVQCNGEHIIHVC